MRRSLAALVLFLLLPLPVLAAQVTVKPGETLSEIADRHGVSLTRLMQLNGISKADHVEVGQVLKLPGNARGSSGNLPRPTGSVRVQEGDTLSGIAARQGMSLSQLMALNGISTADHVEVGQTLKVTGTLPAPAPSYRRGASFHVVKPGESLSEIADGYGLAMSRLVAINQLQDPDHVEIGMRLKLQGPAPTPKAAPTPRPAAASLPVQRPAPAPRPAIPAASVTQATLAAASAPQPRAEQLASRIATPAAETTTPAASSQAAVPAAQTTRPAETARAAAVPISSTVASTPAMGSAVATRPARATSTSTTTTTSTSTSTTVAMATRASSATLTPALATASGPASATPSAATSWRRYGPLQVDWSGWQPMGGSLVAPVMNAKGDTLYLAINCGARKLNATSAAGDWRTWDSPQSDFEQRLVNDLCRSRSS